MPTPRRGYFLTDGTRVPGTTTIISRFKESRALIKWAWQQGRDGKDYEEIRDTAATVGTIAHELVDCYIHRRPFDPAPYAAELVDAAQKPYGAFLKWAESTQLKPVETEIQLVSEQYAFGGTPDAMLVQGRLALGDWKTSNKVYSDHLIQLAAYGLLWEENFPDRPIEGGYHLIRFDKTHGDFGHHWYSDLSEAREAFILMRRLYDLDYALKKRAA